MLSLFTSSWWLFVVRGIFLLIAGALVLLYPGLALEVFILAFAIYAITDGVLSILTAVRKRTDKRWWWGILEGVVSILAGIAAVAFPGLTVITVLYLVAFWVIFTGVMHIITAIQLRKEIANEWWLGLSGVLAILLGVALIAFPGAGILSGLTLIAVYAFIAGVALILFGLKLRGLGPESAAAIPTVIKS